jgi:hypothetical protein
MLTPEDREATLADLGITDPGRNGKPIRDDELVRLVATERRRREAKRIVDEEEAPALEPFGFQGGRTFLEADLEPAPTVVERFARSGHNVVIAAQYKTGKTTFAINLMRCLVEGRPFLGRFEVPAHRRVGFVNLEVGEADMQDWIRALGIDPACWERFTIANSRGRPPRINTPAARAGLVSVLRDLGTQDLVLDCVRPLAAACGMDENSNNDMGRFTGWWDEIKQAAGLSTLWLVHHTGRMQQVEGAERGRGATVLDDWPDMRVLLVADEERRRFVRTEGRIEGLDETQVFYDPETRILSATEAGNGRREAKRKERMDRVLELVTASPGVQAAELRDQMGGRPMDASRAVGEAIGRGIVHFHRAPRGAKAHYPGQGKIHPSGSCACGWKDGAE